MKLTKKIIKEAIEEALKENEKKPWGKIHDTMFKMKKLLIAMKKDLEINPTRANKKRKEIYELLGSLQTYIQQLDTEGEHYGDPEDDRMQHDW